MGAGGRSPPFFPPPTGGFSNLLAKGRCRLLAHNKNLLGHALPPTIEIVRSRRDLAFPPPNVRLAQCFRCISQINILSPGNPAPHRTWNQAHRNFSKELHGSRPHLQPSSSQPHG